MASKTFTEVLDEVTADRRAQTAKHGDELRLVPEVLAEVAAERRAQVDKHGDQAHLLDGTGPDVHVLDDPCRPTYGGTGRLARQHTQATTKAGTLTFADILTEEVYEALAESDDGPLRAELVQVAATAVQWVEAIDSRSGRS